MTTSSRRGRVGTLAAAPGRRTRIAVDARRAQILEATHRVTLRRGLHDLRMSDVADELGISSGLIHYHFATKDDVIEAMLRDVADREVAEVRSAVAGVADPAERLERIIDVYLPSTRRDPSWLLWIDVWGEALRDINLRRISEELDNAWVELIADTVAEGIERGVFRAGDPNAVAWRLCALLDGLGMQVVLHHRTMTRAQMHEHVRRAAALELGSDLPT